MVIRPDVLMKVIGKKFYLSYHVLFLTTYQDRKYLIIIIMIVKPFIEISD